MLLKTRKIIIKKPVTSPDTNIYSDMTALNRLYTEKN